MKKINSNCYAIRERKKPWLTNKSLKKLYNDAYENIIKNSVSDIKQKIGKAGDPHQVFQEENQKHFDRINNFQNDLIRPLPSQVEQEIKTLQGRDKKLSYDTALIQLYPTMNQETINQLIINTATFHAHWDFSIINPQVTLGKESDNENGKSLIYWLGKNETEFVQLIYALYEGKYLTNDRGEITNLIKQVAEVFNIKLKDNWQSNLSKSVHDRKNEPKIFEKLKDAFKSYKSKKR